MTEPEPDRRLWRVRWITYNGLHRRGIYCTEHKRRHESACVSVGLPRPQVEPSTSDVGVTVSDEQPNEVWALQRQPISA